MLSFLFMLAVAAVLGSIGAAIAGRRNLGCLTSIALGFVGALIGRGLARTLDWPDFWTIHIRRTELPVFWTIAGAALFVAVLNLIGGRRNT